MNHLQYFQSTNARSFILTVTLIFSILGCTSIHSDAVKNLIEIETEKIGQAKVNSKDFIDSTNKAINKWKASITSLNNTRKEQRKIESVHALVFSSNQNIQKKEGVDAHAAAYLIGEVYLANHVGIDQAVMNQFTEDFETLEKLAKKISGSWTALNNTQNKINEFAQKSSLASVDPKVVRALIIEFKGDVEEIDKILKRSKQVNEALKKASGAGLLVGSGSERAKTIIEDVIILLEQVKKNS